MSNAEQLLNVLEDIAKLLQKTQVNLKKCPKQRLTKGYLQARLKCLEEYWTDFSKTHQELIKCTTRENRCSMSYFVNEDYYLCEDLYLCLQADLKDMLSSSEIQSGINVASEGHMQTQLVKLPRIELPTFSGKYEEWITFHDLYTSLVHSNTTISDVQKLHYLKSSVVGEAEDLLKNIQVTESNYSQAWLILKQRYANKRLIVNSILRRLFNQKKITQSANQFKSLFDTTNECLSSLSNMGIVTDFWDPLIIFLVVQNLDSESHRHWEEWSYKENLDELPTWDCLKKFLESKFRTLELISPAITREKMTREKILVASTIEKSCIICQDHHTLCHCKGFIGMDSTERSNFVKDNKLCYNCLLPGHSFFRCRVPMSCRICQKRHHTLLHERRREDTTGNLETPIQPVVSVNQSVNENINTETIIASHYTSQQGAALLATAMVTVKSELGHTVVLRALIDQGSQACFISEKATQLLKLRRYHVKGNVIGVGSTKTDVKQAVKLQVLSRYDTDFCLPIQAYVMSKPLTTKVPQSTIILNRNHQHLQNLNLADPQYQTPGSIDLLLGVKEYAHIIQDELIKGPPGTPCAQKTSLGWILFGEINTNNVESSFLVMHHHIEIEDMLKAFWEIDYDTKRKYTREEQQCEEIYINSVNRNEEGRYIVKLPFKTEKLQSPEGNTREIAMNRLLQLERRFKRQPDLKNQYKEVIEEYLTLKHLEQIPKNELCTKKAVYLPHHAVIREDKETTKMRVVFDASCKGYNGVSLNDELLLGPGLQEDLRSIIMRWRLHKVCFVADIHKMYRMVLLNKNDIDFQRILWRKDPSDEVKDYRLLTVTFGTASAPYLACRTLIQLARDEGEYYPIAAKMMLEDFYVDDLLSGCDTLKTAVEAYRQLKGIMQRGGFELKKWSSNNLEFMKLIQPNERSLNAQVDFNIQGTIKALGILWNLKTDRFYYKFSLTPCKSEVTKRNILSDIQKLYDPLGWIAPSIIMAKIFMQKLWLEKISWDDIVSKCLSDEWFQIRSDLENVNEIQVDRWLHTLSTNKEAIQLHGFSDASNQAYAAVVYVRVITLDGTPVTHLVASRTRVAPLKTVSVPRLELCGALLLSKLLKHVMIALRLPTSQIFAWTDSSIVLAWLSGEPNKWKSFVANRVVEILESLNSNQWYHVLSCENPADIASRGMFLSDLKKCNLWWKGPIWLSERDLKLKRPQIIDIEEERKTTIIQANLDMISSDEGSDKSILGQLENFDTLTDLLKTITYCRKFLNYKHTETSKVITPEDLEQSLHVCIKIVQYDEWNLEIEAIKNIKQIKRKSPLKYLCPYLDSCNILRVGGRLKHANLDEYAKHPIILGNKNILTKLIIADAHSKTLHGGIQLMLCYLRSKFWIIKAKGLVKKYLHNCLICAKQRATARTQLMGDLPKQRVTPSRPFLHSGVDFTGPFPILMTRYRGAKTTKAYVAIFVCMATKAIHLELVGDLTSEAFIGAFKRFVSRRGKCAHLWSDQGRNFIGANKELLDAWREHNLEFPGSITETLASEGTHWHFIPAYSPNFGGLWEAGVKSIKYHLKRILNTNLNFEEMTTVLCQIEACLNSRPLCPVDSLDTDKIETLTPGHFLIGEAPLVVPCPSLDNVKVSILNRWKYTQKLLNDFWKRWQVEYLSRLQTRPKWLRKEREFQIGDIVLIKQDNLPPGKWCLGRIVAKHSGHDDITRVYSVKSGSNVIKRSICKLCPLPINNDELF